MIYSSQLKQISKQLAFNHFHHQSHTVLLASGINIWRPGEVYIHQWTGSSLISEMPCHYSDVIMGTMASQITSLTIVYSTVYSGADQRKHQSSASLAFVWGIHRWPVNSQHKSPVTRKMFSSDDVIISPLRRQSIYELTRARCESNPKEQTVI